MSNSVWAFVWEKANSDFLSEAIVAYGTKVDICNRLNDFFYKYRRSGHLLTFVLDGSESVSLASSPLKRLG